MAARVHLYLHVVLYTYVYAFQSYLQPPFYLCCNYVRLILPSSRFLYYPTAAMLSSPFAFLQVSTLLRDTYLRNPSLHASSPAGWFPFFIRFVHTFSLQVILRYFRYTVVPSLTLVPPVSVSYSFPYIIKSTWQVALVGTKQKLNGFYFPKYVRTTFFFKIAYSKK